MVTLFGATYSQAPRQVCELETLNSYPKYGGSGSLQKTTFYCNCVGDRYSQAREDVAHTTI